MTLSYFPICRLSRFRPPQAQSVLCIPRIGCSMHAQACFSRLNCQMFSLSLSLSSFSLLIALISVFLFVFFYFFALSLIRVLPPTFLLLAAMATVKLAGCL